MLAPLVLGALSRKSKSGNLDLGGLKGMLQGEKKAMQQTATGGLLSGLLDQDGDGDFDANDVLALVMKMFNKQGEHKTGFAEAGANRRQKPSPGSKVLGGLHR